MKKLSALTLTEQNGDNWYVRPSEAISTNILTCDTRTTYKACRVAELADARDLKSRVRRGVWVRSPPPALTSRRSARARDDAQARRHRRCCASASGHRSPPPGTNFEGALRS